MLTKIARKLFTQPIANKNIGGEKMFKRRWHSARVLATVLAAVGLTLILVAVALAADEVLFGGFRVTFMSPPAFDGTNTTFTYKICVETSPTNGLSHWNLELCSPPAEVVSAAGYGLDGRAGVIYDWEPVTAGTGGAAISGIRWLDPSGCVGDCTLQTVGDCDEFTVTLSGNWTADTDIDDVSFAIKGGSAPEDVCTDCVTGPACTGDPTAVTLSSFGARFAVTGTDSWLYIGLAGVVLLTVGTVVWSRSRRR